MRARVLAVGLFAGAFSIPANATASCGTVWCAIQASAKKVYESNCVPGSSDDCQFDPLKTAMKGAVDAVVAASCPNFATLGCNWLAVGAYWGLPNGYSLSDPGGSNGGGGSEGWWNMDPCAFEFGIDADGNLIVPSIPLAGGGPIPQGGGYTLFKQDTIPVGKYVHSIKRTGAAIRSLHEFNDYSYGGQKERWLGCYKDDPATGNISCASKSVYIGSTKYSRVTRGYVKDQTTYPVNATDVGCPDDAGTSSADIDFFFRGAGRSGCTAYVKNYALSPSGYVYSPTSSIGWTLWRDRAAFQTQLAGNPVLNCRLTKEFLKFLTNKVIEKSVTDKTKIPVTNEDIVTGGETPTVGDLDNMDKTTEPGDPAPYPEPTDPGPTPTPTPSSSAPSYDPTVSLGDPTAPNIDWWPDLPTLDLDFGSPECPTYSLNLMGWWDQPFILDSHCALVEQNRAAISLLMVAMFTMMGLFIVLRA